MASLCYRLFVWIHVFNCKGGLRREEHLSQLSGIIDNHFTVFGHVFSRFAKPESDNPRRNRTLTTSANCGVCDKVIEGR